MTYVRSAGEASPAIAEAGGTAKIETGASKARVGFIDNVRWVMILLVLSMHAAVTYSPFGNWYYREHPPVGRAETLFFLTYQGVLQGFFMALLFFIAGYFAASSYDAKGAKSFLAGRLYRLGLPTLLYVAAIGPVTEYFLAGSWRHDGFLHEMSLYVVRGRFLAGSGPMWFCVALLIFCGGYAVWRALTPPLSSQARPITPPGVTLTIAALTATTFLARLAFPLGTSVFNLQLCDFASYVVMFALGVAARRSDWLTQTSGRFATLAAAVCLAAAMALWIPLLVLGGATSGRTSDYAGGFHWQAAALALWESLICVGMSFGVLAGFRAFLGRKGALAAFMSDNAFAVYVTHPPIIVGLAVALHPIQAPPIEKFLLLWGLGAAICFGVAAPLVRRAPLLGRIL